MKFPFVRLACLLALLAGAEAVRADTIIFDNLNTTNNGFRGTSATSWDAQRFNSDAINLLLTSATLNLSVNPGAGTFFLRLYSDVAGQPGSAIATFYDGPSLGSGAIAFNNLNQVLLPSTNYWLVLGENPGSTLAVNWGITSTLTGTGSGFQTNAGLTTNSGVNWQTFTNVPYQTQLTATVVPEPSVAFLSGVGLVVLVVLKRRHIRSASHSTTRA